MSQVETVEVETGAAPVGSVIWLHGLGADGHDFEPIVPELRLPGSLALRFVFPHAPVQPVTINGGMAMRAWYDIVSLDSEGVADEVGVRASSDILDRLIERELERGIEANDIVVAGFSQGGAIALHNAMQSAHRLRGLMALSAYLPLAKLVAKEIADNTKARHPSLNVFMAHGSLDPVVPYQAGKHAAETLEQLGYTVEWHDYPMAHNVCPQEIADIRTWLLAIYGVSS